MENMVATSTTTFNTWSPPSLMETIVNHDSIELIYKQYSMMSNNFGNCPSRCYKIIYSCKDGKWHESEMLEGIIMEATQERYEF